MCEYTVGPSFKVVFAEKSTCGSREQCTRPTYENADTQFISFQQHPNGYLVSMANHKINHFDGIFDKLSKVKLLKNSIFNYLI